MEADLFRRTQVLINEKMNMTGFIIDQPEGGYRARRHSKVFLHSPVGGEGQFPLFQQLLQVPDGQVAGMLDDDQVMTVALMVPEKQVLAVGGFNVPPVFPGLLDGRHRWMLVVFERDVQLFKDPVQTGIAVHCTDFGHKFTPVRGKDQTDFVYSQEKPGIR